MSSIASASAPSLEFHSVSFFGRTLAEYQRFFALDLDALKGADVLDVAAGPAGFTAEANRLGIHAVAVDPLYGNSPEVLEQHVAIDYRAMFAQMRAKPELFKAKAFASIDEAESSRRRAARSFLTDYGAHFVQGRYVGARLPHLPFEDEQFDLVLCAHLLFVYAKLLSFDFHVKACVELVRVTRGDVRLHPVVGADGIVYAQLPELRAALATHGIDSEVVSLDYEFFAGSDSMLVLRRAD